MDQETKELLFRAKNEIQSLRREREISNARLGMFDAVMSSRRKAQNKVIWQYYISARLLLRF